MPCSCAVCGGSSSKDKPSSPSPLVKGDKIPNPSPSPARRNASARGDCILKICLCGQAGVGKTSLARRFVYGVANHNLRPTLGLDFFTKTMVVDGDCVTLQLFDLQGQDLGGRTKAATNFHYRGSRGVLIVCDASELMTASSEQEGEGKEKKMFPPRDASDIDNDEHCKAMQEAINWKKDVDDKLLKAAGVRVNNRQEVCDEQEHEASEGKIPVVLVVNKMDVPETKQQTDLVKRRAETLKARCAFDEVFFVSAMTGALVQESFLDIVGKALGK